MISPPPAISDRRLRFMIWICLWGGGAAWLLHLLAVWIIAEFGCLSSFSHLGFMGMTSVAWAILGISLLCAAVTVLAIVVSVHCSRQGGDSFRFVSRYGIAANPVFLLIITAQTLPVFYHLGDCGSNMMK
jgi:hypothetical protein